MQQYDVTVRKVVIETATVEAESEEQARHLIEVSLNLAEEQNEDDLDAIDWDFPQPWDVDEVGILSIKPQS